MSKKNKKFSMTIAADRRNDAFPLTHDDAMISDMMEEVRQYEHT